MKTYPKGTPSKPKIISKFLIEEINYLVADSNYTMLYLRNKRKLISSYSLKVFEELLAERNFIRTDRSHLVNKSFIENICENGIVHLKNKIQLTIPRRRKASIINEYSNLLNLNFNA